MDELIAVVAQRAGISPAQTTVTTAAMLNYLTVRLPSSVVGRIREQLVEVQTPHTPEGREGDVQ